MHNSDFFWRTLVCFGTCVGESQSIIVKKTVSGLLGDKVVRVCVTVARSLKTATIQDEAALVSGQLKQHNIPARLF
jgi:hypothetical protein